MNDESEEFLDLFGGEEVVYIEGARTNTGFFTVEKPPHVTRYLFYPISTIPLALVNLQIRRVSLHMG